MSIWQVQIHQLPLKVVSACDISQQKIDEIFKDLPNVFAMADDILIIGYDADGRDHDRSLKHVMQTWH